MGRGCELFTVPTGVDARVGSACLWNNECFVGDTVDERTIGERIGEIVEWMIVVRPLNGKRGVHGRVNGANTA